MERNDQLRAAREATSSPRVPNAAMSRCELADTVNAWLVAHTDRHGVLDEHYVARLERGKIRWPNSDYRAGFAAVLGRDETELGFRPSLAHRRPVRPLSTSEPARQSNDLARPMGVADGTYRDGPVEVVAIRAMSRAFQAADRQVGGGVLYGQVMRYLNTEIGPRLLDAEGTNGSALFTAASSLTEFAGWMAHDCGQDHRARQHFDRKQHCQHAADHGGSIPASSRQYPSRQD